MLTQAVLLTTFVAAAGIALRPGVIRFLKEHNVTDTNYRGETVPTACGLFLMLLMVCAYLFQKAAGWGSTPLSADFVLAVCGVGFAGLIDDVIGDKKIKGIAGHWKAWRESGVPGTAVVKAAATAAAAFIVLSDHDNSPGRFMLHMALLLLATNAANLMDVRPGRALKFHFAMLAWLSAAAGGLMDAEAGMELAAGCLIPIAAGSALLLFPDLKGKMMLGDTGANMLGFSIGCGFVWYADTPVQLLLLALLIALHALTWRRSLTRIIENNRWLRFLDVLGRE